MSVMVRKNPVVTGNNVSHIPGWTYTGDGSEPWGIYDPSIRVREFTPQAVVLLSPNGRHYDTIRDLFSQFRLETCECDRKTDRLEKIEHSLRAIDQDIHLKDRAFFVDDVYDGSWAYMEDHVDTLERYKFVGCEGSSLDKVFISAEGRAVIKMLSLTRRGSNVDTSPRGILKMRSARVGVEETDR